MPRRKQQTPKRLKTGNESDDDQDDDQVSSDEENHETDSTRASTPPMLDSPLRSLSIMVGETLSSNFKKDLRLKEKERINSTQKLPFDFTTKSQHEDSETSVKGKPNQEQEVALDLSLKRSHSETGYSDKTPTEQSVVLKSRSPSNRSPVELKPVQRHHDNNTKSKERSSSTTESTPVKGNKKTVHHNLIPKEALVNISKMHSDYNVLPPQVNFYRTASDQGNFVLCTDCYQAFPNIGMLSIHLIATGHKSMKSVNTQLLRERGYNVMMAPKGNLFSTCSLRRRPKPPGGFRTRDICSYRCAVCGGTFCDFFEYTVHLSKTKHDQKQLSNKGFDARSKIETSAFQEEIPVAQVMKCIVCRESFCNLEDLTMHMLRTQHYNKVPGHKSGYSHRNESVSSAAGRDIDEDYEDLMDTSNAPPGLMIPDKVCVISRDSPNFQALSQVNFSKTNEIMASQPLKAQRPSHNSELNMNWQCSPSDSDIEEPYQSDEQLLVNNSADNPNWRKSRALRCFHCSHTFANIQRLSAHMKLSGHYPGEQQSWKTMQQRPTDNGTFTHMKLMSTQQQVANKLSINNSGRAGQEEIEFNGEMAKFCPGIESSGHEETHIKHGRLETLVHRSNNNQEIKKPSPNITLPDYIPKENSIQQLYSFVHNETPPKSSHAQLKKYVDPDNFVVVLPTGSKVKTDKMSENPLGSLACMVQTAKEMNFEKSTFSSNVDRWVTRAVDDNEDEINTIPSMLTGLPKWYSAQQLHFRQMNRRNSQETMSDKTDVESSHSEEKDTPSIKTESTDVDLEQVNKATDSDVLTANTLIEKLVNDSDNTDVEKADEIERDKNIRHDIHAPNDSSCPESPLSVSSRRSMEEVENVHGKYGTGSQEFELTDEFVVRKSIKAEPVQIWPEPGSGVIVTRTFYPQKYPPEPMHTESIHYSKKNCGNHLVHSLSSDMGDDTCTNESPVDKLIASVNDIPLAREENGTCELRNTSPTIKSKIIIKEEPVSSKPWTRKKHENAPPPPPPPPPIQYIRPHDGTDPFCMSDPLSEIDKLVSSTTGTSGNKSLMPVKMGKFLKDIKPTVSTFRPSQQYFREMYTPTSSNMASDPLKEMDRMVNATT